MPSAQAYPLIEPHNAERVAELTRALSGLRIMLLAHLAKNGPSTVSDCIPVLDLSQPTTSHHLRELAHVGLVENWKQGVWVIYQLTPAGTTVLAAIEAWLELPANPEE